MLLYRPRLVLLYYLKTTEWTPARADFLKRNRPIGCSGLAFFRRSSSSMAPTSRNGNWVDCRTGLTGSDLNYKILFKMRRINW
jgi:hypothetical protein